MMNVKKLLFCLLFLCAALLSSCAAEECDSYVSMTDVITESDPEEDPTHVPSEESSESLEAPTESTPPEETETEPTTVESATESSLETTEAESETQSEEPSQTRGEDPEEEPFARDPEQVLSDLRSANRITERLAEKGGVLVRLTDAKKTDEEQLLFCFLQNGEVVIDQRTVGKDGAALSAYTVRDGALYSVEGEQLSFAILPDGGTEYLCKTFVPDLFPSSLSALACTEESGALLLQTSLNSDALNENERIEYVYTVDAETMRLETVEILFFSFDSLIGHQTLAIGTADGENAPEMLAYNAHVNAEDAVCLHVEIKPQSGGETRLYTVSASTSVCAYPSERGEAFAVYKNEACTKDIKDLSFALGTEPYVYVSEWEGEISLEFCLTAEDLEAFRAAVEEFEALAIEGKAAAKVIEAYYEVNALYEYIDSQSVAAYVQYYSDLSSEEGQENFMLAQSIGGEVRTVLTSAYAEILASDSPICTLLFAGWSDEELAALSVDRAAVSVLEEKNAALLTEYHELTQDADWGDAVNRLYEEFVTNNNEIAALSGYANYYEYATNGYRRDYGVEEREAFRAYVRTYVIPLYEKTLKRFYEVSSSLTLSQREWIAALTSRAYTEHSIIKRYVDGYIASFTPTLAENMSAMLEKDVMIIGTEQTSYQGAFTTYLSLYEEPVAYFAAGSLDALTVIHENGHYAAFCSLGTSQLPGLDLCETHSQGNEWLFIAYLEGQLDPAVHEALTLVRLLNGLNVVIYATVVDECEELIYTAEEPYSAEEYDALIDSVIASYGTYAQENFTNLRSYFKMVSMNSPVYYLSYATSELASMSLYLVAKEDFDTAIGAYTALIEGVTPDAHFLASLTENGLPTPFEEATFLMLTEVFGAYLSEDALSNAA